VFAHFDAIDLTENHISQLHHDLLVHSNKDERHRGNYKTNTNHVVAFDADGNETGIVFETATPFDTPRLMSELVQWTRSKLDEGQLHPLLIIAVFVVIFLEIHPYQDGNGRLSRILTTLLLLCSGYAYVSYSSLESVIEKTKENYYACLRGSQYTPVCPRNNLLQRGNCLVGKPAGPGGASLYQPAMGFMIQGLAVMSQGIKHHTALFNMACPQYRLFTSRGCTRCD